MHLPVSFISAGKLLLTGEYLVLAGARALALPVRYTQKLSVSETPGSNMVSWKAFEPGGCWFHAVFSTNLAQVIETSDWLVCQKLLELLSAAKQLNRGFLDNHGTVGVITTTDFPVKWGLGTSSTLISNVAYWSGSDPFALHRLVSTGSGYDVACARASSPIIFQLEEKGPVIHEIAFDPLFKAQIFFVYLGQKQVSETSIRGFSRDKNLYVPELPAISEITDLFAATVSLAEAQSLMLEHERIIGKLIGMETVQSRLFSDFPGVIKSLGAWGGDFLMVLTDMPAEVVRSYFARKLLDTVINFSDMVSPGT